MKFSFEFAVLLREDMSVCSCDFDVRFQIKVFGWTLGKKEKVSDSGLYSTVHSPRAQLLIWGQLKLKV